MLFSCSTDSLIDTTNNSDLDTSTATTLPYYWIFTFCFDGPGNYTIETAITGLVNGTSSGSAVGAGCNYDSITISIGNSDITGCDNPCTYGICWEDMIMDQLTDISFFDPNGVYGELDFDPPLDIDLRFEYIMESILEALDAEVMDPTSLLYGLDYGTFTDEHPDSDCNKGGYDTPGFFFMGSEFKFLEFMGETDGGASYPPGTAVFKRYGDCE